MDWASQFRETEMYRKAITTTAAITTITLSSTAAATSTYC